MPRPKSEITDNARMVGIRLTPRQHAMWKELGGPVWLRKLLAQEMEKKYAVPRN